MIEFRTKIEEIGFGGEGVCHNNGKVCFVNHVLPGEEVLIEKYQEKGKYDLGKVKNIFEKDKDRIEPKCKYFGDCGGCDFQFVTYARELAIKKEIAYKQLKKLGYDTKFNIVASEDDFSYRNKIRLFPGESKLGLKKEKSNTVVEISRCEISKELINKNLDVLNEFVYSQNLNKKLNYIEIRCIANQLLINLFLKATTKYSVSSLQNKFIGEFGLYETINGVEKHIFGIKSITMKQNNLVFNISSNSFIQVNEKVAEKLYNKIISFVKGGIIVNCYSGAGLLSAMLCLNGARKVYGIELGSNEHKDAENLKNVNEIYNLINIKGDCATELPKVVKEAEFIIVDPPRKGCDEKVCQVLNDSTVSSIVYISCNHATFARDISRLTNYKIDYLELYDMFPRTCNFEIFAILKKV